MILSKSIAAKVTASVVALFAILFVILTYINYSDAKNNSLELLNVERTKAINATQTILKENIGTSVEEIENLANLIAKSDFAR